MRAPIPLGRHRRVLRISSPREEDSEILDRNVYGQLVLAARHANCAICAALRGKEASERPVRRTISKACKATGTHLALQNFSFDESVQLVLITQWNICRPVFRQICHALALPKVSTYIAAHTLSVSNNTTQSKVSTALQDCTQPSGRGRERLSGR